MRGAPGWLPLMADGQSAEMFWDFGLTRGSEIGVNSPFLQTFLPLHYRLMMGWTGPAGDAGRVLVGAASAPQHGLDALDVARVRCVRR